MIKLRCCVSLLGLVVASFAAAHGQAIPAAVQAGILTIGVDGSISSTDIFKGSKHNLTGVGFFGNYELGGHLSAVADVHLQMISTPDDFVENTYLIGPRYNFHYGRFEPYIKVEAGVGTTSIVDNDYSYRPNTPGKFFALAFGAGVDVRIKGPWLFHADVEHQDWPGFSPHGLTPNLVAFGVGYRFRP